MRRLWMAELRRGTNAILVLAVLLGMNQWRHVHLYAQGAAGSSMVSAGWVEVGADRIFYEDVGEGPALILIHDGLVNREIWDAQMPVLSENFRVIRYDRRGYGASPAPTEQYSNVEDLVRLLGHLRVEEACLVAMSSGGRFAIDFALEHPDKVSSLILVGAVVGGFSYTEHFFNRGGHLPPDLTTSERRAYYVSEDPYEIYPGNVTARERVADIVGRYPIQGHGAFPSARPARPAVERLNEIDFPTLVLVGEFDIPDVHAHAGAINAGIRGSERAIVSGAGHLIPIEQPNAFNVAVLEFLNRIARE